MKPRRRPQTSADRCADCACSRRKSDRVKEDADGWFLDFREAVRTETPFWCHSGGKGKEHYERQVCRGWLAIMERKWRGQGWDIENPR